MKGVDVTEAFESHHVKSSRPEELLKKYFIRKASKPRNYPYTFAEDGFYKILKSRVREELKKIPENESDKSKRVLEILVLNMFIFSIFSCVFNKIITRLFHCTLTGILMSWTLTSGHNFLHQRDNWRMYLFNFSLLATREFRITHALSHHQYTNTLYDMEISQLEPFFHWLPYNSKTFFARYSPIITGFFIYPFMTIYSVINRILSLFIDKTKYVIHIEDVVPYILPLTMYMLGNLSLVDTLLNWLVIILVSSFLSGFLQFNGVHHHPDLFHDGDEPIKDMDWGIHQLDTVMERADINNSFFMILTNFGDHGLHHLFPTLDHAILNKLYPVFFKTCEEFQLQLKSSYLVNMLIASYRQMARNECRKLIY